MMVAAGSIGERSNDENLFAEPGHVESLHDCDRVSREDIERGAKPPLQEDVLGELVGTLGSLW